MSRRELMVLGGVAALAARCGGTSTPDAPAAGAAADAKTYLSSAELAMVDELSELIDSDRRSLGRPRAAGVAAYIDRSLAEAFEENVRTTWRNGLRRIRRTVATGSPEAVHVSVSRPAPGGPAQDRTDKAKPEKPEEEFFVN